VRQRGRAVPPLRGSVRAVLVRDDPAGPEGAWLAIGQPAHAWVSGQAARAWGNADFPAPSPWEEVCLAAEQHDVGMAEWDLAPALNPATGRAQSFIEMPRRVHVALWSHAGERLLAQSRYAALLVSLHGTTLYERYPAVSDLEAVEAYLAAQRAFQQALRSSLRAPAEEVDRNRELVFVWDWLSLALCLDWAPAESPPAPGARGSVPLRLAVDGDTLTLDPWPFAATSVRLHTEGRRLVGPYESEPALHAALATAPWTALEWQLMAPSGD
jgi:hypothetical protein